MEILGRGVVTRCGRRCDRPLRGFRVAEFRVLGLEFGGRGVQGLGVRVVRACEGSGIQGLG